MKVNFNLEEAKELLRENWNSDFDIEIDTNTGRGKDNTLIFSFDGESYWKDGKWNFSGYRMIASPNYRYATQEFYKFLEDEFGERFELEDALEFVENYYYQA